MFLHGVVICPFSLLYSIPPHDHITFYLSIFLLMDSFLPSLDLLQIMLLGIFLWSFGVHMLGSANLKNN